MEVGYEVGTAMLVSLIDGTTSLYYSTGGGMIGSGSYPPLAEASRSFITQAEAHLNRIPTCSVFPLPEVNQVRFIILTFSRKHSIVLPLNTLVTGEAPLGPLYSKAQNTLTELHRSDGQKHK
jgi:hypothetical protein